MNFSKFIISVRNSLELVREKNDFRALIHLFVFTVAVGWFLQSVEPVLGFVNTWFQCLFISSSRQCIMLERPSVLQVIPSLLLLLGVSYRLTRSYGGRELEVNTYMDAASRNPKKGLIYLLGAYNPRIRPETEDLGVPLTVYELSDVLDQDDLEGGDLRTKILTTNWGPFWVAVEAHKSRLEHVWLISSKGKKGSFEQTGIAAKLVQKICEHEGLVAIHGDPSFAVENAHEVHATLHMVEKVFKKEIPALSLEVQDVVSDITGATKSMTAGMILATLDENQKIQYLRQDIPLVQKVGKTHFAMSREDIEQRKLLATIETRKDFVYGL